MSIFYTNAYPQNYYIAQFREMDKFQIIQPSASLAPYIKQFWFLAMGNSVCNPQRLVPLGCVVLSYQRGSRIYSSHNDNYLPSSYLNGTTTDYTDLTFSGFTPSELIQASDSTYSNYHALFRLAFIDLPSKEY